MTNPKSSVKCPLDPRWATVNGEVPWPGGFQEVDDPDTQVQQVILKAIFVGIIPHQNGRSPSSKSLPSDTPTSDSISSS